jgi:hypothetical protein
LEYQVDQSLLSGKNIGVKIPGNDYGTIVDGNEQMYGIQKVSKVFIRKYFCCYFFPAVTR